MMGQAERINLLKQAVEKYGNGKKDEDLTPCVVVGAADAAAGSASTAGKRKSEC